jgi:hypothetical protein
MLESFRYKTRSCCITPFLPNRINDSARLCNMFYWSNCGATVPSRTGGTERDEATGADDITLPDVLR